VSRLADMQRIYALLTQQAKKIGGAAPLASLEMRKLPRRGVYFFFEAGEVRQESGTGPRVVRVGTHALGAGARSTLKQRLSQHRGGRSGSGNHRGSIFRLLVGKALIAAGIQDECPSWGVKGDAKNAATLLGQPLAALKDAEEPVERAVSNYIGAMTVVCIGIDDEPGPNSLRGRIERNAIALLSNRNRPSLDSPSPNWLGQHSQRILVCASGLWNQNHVDEMYDPSFLLDLQHLIERDDNADVYR
jgi:hypothetical protein